MKQKRKIIAYNIVSTDPNYMNEVAAKRIQDGWQPKGKLSIIPNKHFPTDKSMMTCVQVFVKYEEENNEPKTSTT